MKKKATFRKSKTTYRIDCTYNNDRLCIDVRDNLSLLQALASDQQLDLDPFTMAYMISLNRSLLITSENVSEDVIKITSESIYKLKDGILNEEKKALKQEEKALKKESKKKDKEKGKETSKEALKPNLGLVEEVLNEEESEGEEFDETSEEEFDEEDLEEDEE